MESREGAGVEADNLSTVFRRAMKEVARLDGFAIAIPPGTKIIVPDDDHEYDIVSRSFDLREGFAYDLAVPGDGSP